MHEAEEINTQGRYLDNSVSRLELTLLLSKENLRRLLAPAREDDQRSITMLPMPCHAMQFHVVPCLLPNWVD
jgi:hypothetical protein